MDDEELEVCCDRTDGLHTHTVWEGQEHDPECRFAGSGDFGPDPESCCDGGQARMVLVVCRGEGTRV